jgi:hypothetical protein
VVRYVDSVGCLTPKKNDAIYNLHYFVQSLLYLPFAIANALTARLNDGYVVI